MRSNSKFLNWLRKVLQSIKDAFTFGKYDKMMSALDNLIAEAVANGAQSEGVRYSISEDQASAIIEAMKANAEVAPQIELTPENWVAEFGAEGMVSTPIGEVIMGEHQYKKLVDNKRSNDFGKVKPTLTNPDIVLEEYDPKEGALRDTKYLFIKAFAKPNREKIRLIGQN